MRGSGRRDVVAGRGEKQLVPACEIPCEIALCPTACPSTVVPLPGAKCPAWQGQSSPTPPGWQQRGQAGRTRGAQGPVSGRLEVIGDRNQLWVKHQSSCPRSARPLIPPQRQGQAPSQGYGNKAKAAVLPPAPPAPGLG